MALKGSISRTLSYNSMIGDMVAVYMSATIPDDGVPSRSMNIADNALYRANKEECRADIREFNQLVDNIEDENVN